MDDTTTNENQFAFTDARVRAIEPTSKEAWYTDTNKRAPNGFKLRVTPSGGKRFVLVARIQGNSRKLTLGDFPGLSTLEAREAAKIKTGEIAKGIDPRVENLKAKSEKKTNSLTLRVAVEQYLKRKRNRMKPKTADGYRKQLLTSKKSGIPEWADLPAVDITRDMVLAWYTKRAEKNPASATQEARYLRAVLNGLNAVEPGTIADNPVNVLSAVSLWERPSPRKSFIKEEKMPAFLDGLESLQSDRGQYDIAADYLKFLLFSGCRLSEIATLKVNQIDLESRIFKLEDTKNRDDVELPLNDILLEIIRKRLADVPDDGFVFPSTTGGEFGRPKRAIAKLIKDSGVDFMPHDLRRTFRSSAEKCGLGMKQGMMLINHKYSGALAVDLNYIQVSPTDLLKASNRVADELLRQAGRKTSKRISK